MTVLTVVLMYFSVSGLVFTFLWSPATPNSLRNLISDYISSVQIAISTEFPAIDLILLTKQVNFSDNYLNIETQDANVVFDLTCDASYSRFLGFLAVQNDFLHIVANRSPEIREIPGENTLFLEPDDRDQAVIFAYLVKYFNWKNIGVFLTSTSQNRLCAVHFESLLLLSNLRLHFKSILTSTNLNDQVSLIPTTDATVFILFTDEITAARVAHYADERSLGGSGYVWMFSEQAMGRTERLMELSNVGGNKALMGVVRTGVVGVRDEELEGSEVYVSLALSVAQAYTSHLFTGSVLRTYLQSHSSLHFSPSGYRQPSYILQNMVDFHLYSIAKWNSTTLTMQWTARPITWPGGSTLVPNDTVTVLSLGVLLPLTTSTGGRTKVGKEIKSAVELAVRYVNSNGFFGGNVYLKGKFIDTAESEELCAANINAVAGENILGFVGPLDSSLVLPYIQAISTLLPTPKPLVSYGASSINLTNPTLVPYFLRTIQQDSDAGLAIAQFIRKNEWNRVGVLYTSDDYGQGLYTGFTSNSDNLGIRIENRMEKRRVSYDGKKWSKETNRTIEEGLEELVRSQIRVVVYLGPGEVGMEVVLRASGKELTGEKYVWVGGEWMSDEGLLKTEEVYGKEAYEQIRSGLEGGFGIAQRTEEVPADIQGLGIYSLLAYDSVLLYSQAISSMLLKSQDYRHSKSLLDTLKTTDFLGVTGPIHFSGNDRTAYGYVILNYLPSHTLSQVFTYDPRSSDLFTPTGNPVYWRGQTPPSDSFSTYNCPFPEHMVRVYWLGIGIVIIIGVCLFFITFLLSFLSYRKWKMIKIQPIPMHTRKTWKDFMLQIGIIIEFFQLMSLAPYFPVLKTVLEVISSLAMLDPMKLLNLPTEIYWVQLTIICIFCYLWFLLVFLIISEKYFHCIQSIKRSVELISDIYLPLAGNLLFFPFLAQLVDALVCDHMVLGRAFVWRDCYMTCWSGAHSPYVTLSLTAIVLYEPLAAYSQPLWQQTDSDLNLLLKPEFLLFQTCIQVLLIAVGNSLNSTNEIAHGCIYTLLMAAYTAFTWKSKPFNEHRCNLWELVSLGCVTGYSFFATVSHAYDPSNLAWFISLAILWGCIGLTAIGIQCAYLPSRFRPPKGVATRKSVSEVFRMRHLRHLAATEVNEENEAPSTPNVTPCSGVLSD